MLNEINKKSNNTNNFSLLSTLYSLLFKESGQSLVEFVLIFPVVIMMVMAVLQLSLIANAQTVFNYAVYAAVRAGVVQRNPSDQNTLRAAAGYVCLPLDRSAIMKINFDRVERRNSNLEVEATYHYQLIIPFISGVLRTFSTNVAFDPWSFTGVPHIPLHSRCAMLIESPGPS